jgi:multiple sugar transport system substrate-binding protein
MKMTKWSDGKGLSRRDFLRLSAVAATGALAAACAPKTQAPVEEVVKPEEKQEEAKPKEETKAPAAEKVTVTYLVRNDLSPMMKEWEDLTVEEFESMNPNITVNVVGVPWGDYNAKLLAMYAAGTPPEISANYAAGFPTFYANDAIVALDDLVDSKNVDLSVFEKACIDALTRKGKLWALPLAHMPTIIFYNKSLLDKAGVEAPPIDWADTSWTVDKLFEVSQQLSHDTDDPTKAEWGVQFFTGQLGVASWLWGADPFNDQGGPDKTEAYQTGEVTAAFYTQEKVVAMHQFRRDLTYVHGVSPKPSDTDLLTQVQGFNLMTGRIGMTIDGGWQFTQFAAVKPSWEWGVAAMPYGPGGVNTTPLFNDSWMLSKGAKEQEAGFELLTYLTVGKGAEHYARITGFIPANKELYPIFFDSIEAVPNLALSREELEKAVKDAFAYGYATPGKTLDRYPEWNSAYNQTTGPIWNDEVSVEEGLQAVQERFDQIIATLA